MNDPIEPTDAMFAAAVGGATEDAAREYREALADALASLGSRGEVVERVLVVLVDHDCFDRVESDDELAERIVSAVFKER